MPAQTFSAPPPVVPEHLLRLAPTSLENRRVDRYVGDNLCVPLDGLEEADQVLLRDTYEVLSELLYAITDPASGEAARWQGIERWLQRHSLDDLVDQIHVLGQASYERDLSEELSKTLHDVRGGALAALLGRLQLIDRTPRDEKHLRMIFVLTRDHLKIMRNALTGLDEPRREADRKPKAHTVQLMVDKWHESTVGPKWHERPVRLHIDCRYQGALTECCLESAAIDRIFYNLANNACRHAAGDRLDMVIFPLPGQPATCLRFVLSNEVSDEDAAHLRTLEGGAVAADAAGSSLSLPSLFEPEISATGSGFGLTVVADFVAGAFGLSDRHEAIAKRYVGAVLDGQTFRAWFHWPLAQDDLPPKTDDYHHPEQSLSEPGDR